MEYNMSLLDIVLRYAVILVLGILFGITQFFPLIVVAIVVFISAVTGVCPLYAMLGISTKKKKEA